jgi:hypothetical protein
MGGLKMGTNELKLRTIRERLLSWKLKTENLKLFGERIKGTVLFI